MTTKEGNKQLTNHDELQCLWQEMLQQETDTETAATFATSVVTTALLDSVVVPALKFNSPVEEGENNDEVHICRALACLVSFVKSKSSKDDKIVVVSSGALNQTLQVLRRVCTPQKQKQQKLVFQEELASLSVQVLSHLATDASDVLKNDHLLPAVPTVHKVMHRYLTVNDGADVQTHLTEIQRYGCIFLHQLSNPLLQELVAAGSMDVIVSAMRQHPEDSGVQEHGNATMYNLLPLVASSRSSPLGSPCAADESWTSSSSSVCSASSLLLSDLPEIVIRGMGIHPDHVSVQQYGILVLKRLCQNDAGNYEDIIAQGGLTVILRNVTVPSLNEKAHQSFDAANDRECLAQLAIQFLQDLFRPSNYDDMDVLRAIAAKGGMDATLQLMNPSDSNPYRGSVNIQDPAMAVLRNLCIHPDNRWEVVSTDDHRHIVPSVLSTMDRFLQDAAIQAYGCDVLGRLALAKSTMVVNDTNDNSEQGNDETKTNDDKHDGDDVASVVCQVYKALKTHRNHAGVQDRSIFVLLALCSSKKQGGHAMECLFSQRHVEETNEDVIDFVKMANVPPKGCDRLNLLVELLEQKIGLNDNGKTQESPGKENMGVFKGWRKATSWMNRNGSPNTTNTSAASKVKDGNTGLSWRRATSSSSISY